jgi:hypothetical protein
MADMADSIAALSGLPTAELRARWRAGYRKAPPPCLSRDLLIRGIAYQLQAQARGGLSPATKRQLRTLTRQLKADGQTALGGSLKPGARLVREWRNRTHIVIVRENSYEYKGHRYRSLTQIAWAITGAHWSGPRFFGLKASKSSRRSLETDRDTRGE